MKGELEELFQRDPPDHWDNLTSLEKDNYLMMAYGPRHRFGRTVSVIMTTFYATLFGLGVPGNLLSCMIIYLNRYMQTPPNYYLVNLAIADILTLTIGKKNRHSIDNTSLRVCSCPSSVIFICGCHPWMRFLHP